MCDKSDVQRNEEEERVESERLDPYEVLRALITLHEENLLFSPSADARHRFLHVKKRLREIDQKNSVGSLERP